MEEKLRSLLLKQHYKIAGRHSAVKLCHWLKKSILGEGCCYKEDFYGISSHRCLQFTPAVEYCSHQCVYCWRNMEYTNPEPMTDFDGPEEIIDEAIGCQRLLLTGYGGIMDRVVERKYLEAHHPNQAAISLAGEPTYYPKLSELLGCFHDRGFTTFLVSNGTNPQALENLDVLPTQMYVSLDAPSRKDYLEICNPLLEGLWENILESQKVVSEMDCRTVNRLTLIKEVNMQMLEGYAELISMAEPDYVEVKGFMFVGGARQRLRLRNMPSHSEILDFSEKLSEILGYKITKMREDSRVVLLEKN